MLYYLHRQKDGKQMKSANPEVIDKVSHSLSKDPIDTVTILNLFPEDNKFLVSTILDYCVTLNNTLQENKSMLYETKNTLQATEKALSSVQKMITEYETKDRVYQLKLREQEATIKNIQKTENLRVNQMTLSKFFLNHEHILKDYSLSGDNQILYKGDLLDSSSTTLLELSIDLETYFGNKNIHLKVLLSAIKRYLITVQKNANYFQDYLIEVVEEYLSQQTTKKRRRVGLSYLRNICKDVPELTVANIKSIMYNAGYFTKTDKSHKVFFYKENPDEN